MSTLLDAARWTGRDPEPHQLAAWNWLDQQISNEERDEFLDLFRAAPAPKAPLVQPAPKDPPDGPLGELLALIRRGEGSWNSVNRGRAGDTPGGWTGLTSMTLGEVMAAQKAGKVFAVGSYQFIPATLAEAVAKLKLQPGELFSPTLQNRLAIELILGGWKRQGLSRYLLGHWQDTEGNLSRAQNELAYEWASLPNSEGRGWYDGDSAGNRAHGDVEEVRAVLRRTRQRLTAASEATPLQPAQPEAPARPVPRYFSQRDNGAQADRSCFSSTCAMLAAMVKPGSIGPGSNADLDYLNRVLRHGDTIHAHAQIAALRELGITARLVRNGGQALIDEQVKRWGGIALGYIHRGPLGQLDDRSAGHWCLCWGASQESLTLHDPMGRPHIIRGGFTGESGQSVMVSRGEFARRWELTGPPYRYAPGHGWALVIDGVDP
jgi:hypothetical protein